MTPPESTADAGRDGATTAPPVLPGCAPAPDGQHERSVHDLLRLLEANRHLQAVLDANAALCESSLLAMLDGADPAAAIDRVDVARARRELADAIAAFARARHRARGTFITAQFLHGLNMREIGRRWGISRQLAHRFYKEAHGEG